jgi:Mg2+ and Co2+ transporter CorA
MKDHKPIPFEEYLGQRTKEISCEWERIVSPLIKILVAKKKECDGELGKAESHYQIVKQHISDNFTALVRQLEVVRKELEASVTQKQSKDVEALFKYQQAIIEKTAELKSESLLVPIQSGSSLASSEWKNLKKVQDKLQLTLTR